MTSLATLLRQRASSSNLGSEKTTTGVVYYKSASHPALTYAGIDTLVTPCCTIWGHNEYCWKSPGSGKVVVEVWGSGGMSGRMCCCASPQLPGNPGAYVKKTINVNSNSYVCGKLGASPAACVLNGGALCTYGSRSYASCLTLCHVDGCSCLCAQGGCSGVIYCMTTVNSCAVAACFAAGQFDITYVNDCWCSIICNNKSGAGSNVHAIAYGGDVNVNGGISSMFLRCWNDACYFTGRVENRMALPAGYFTSDAPFYLNYLQNTDCTLTLTHCSAMSGRMAMMHALSSVTGQMVFPQTCWSGAVDCTCYENNGVTPIPAGFPAPTGTVTGNVRTTGHVGGHGAVKITYLASS